MPSHVHLIFRAKESNRGELLKSLKVYTSKKLAKAIEKNLQESRKDWMLGLMEKTGEKAVMLPIDNFGNNTTGR